MFPKLRWVDRVMEDIDQTRKTNALRRVIITGICRQKVDADTKVLFPPPENIIFVLVYNVLLEKAETFKLLPYLSTHVTSLAFGPYDNGHVLLGLSTGNLIALDLITLNVLLKIKVMSDSVTNIVFDPTNTVIVSGEGNEVASFSLVKRKHSYVYLEMGQRKYCTVKIPK